MLLWIDGFDHYGITSNMLDGPYAANSANDVSNANPRTGTYSLFNDGIGIGADTRRVFGSALTSVGVGAAFYLDNLPSVDDRYILFEFRDATNAIQTTIFVRTTGAIAAVRGGVGGTTLGVSSTLMTSDAYNHVEVFITVNNSSGAVGVRLNGVSILNLTGIDTQNTALAETSQCVVSSNANSAPSPGVPAYCDDLYAWDTTGSFNNTYVGDKKVYLLLPDADTAEADWVPNSGSVGFDRINEVPPNDDTSYVEAVNSGDISQFGLTDLPPEVVSVQGVYVPGFLRKTDAGTNDVQSSMVSGVSVGNGTSRPMTTAYTYWPDVYETDPATSALWTPAAVNASQVRFTRTA